MTQAQQATPISSLQDEQTKVLYRSAAFGLLVSVINATLIVVLEWDVFPQTPLLWWLGTVCSVTALRAGIVWGYWNHTPAGWTTADWYRWALRGVTATGLAWGASTWFLGPDVPRANELLLLFVMTGMVAGAVPILALVLPAFLLFNATVSIPLLYHFATAGDPFHWTLAGMTILFVSATTYSAWNLNHAVLTSLRLRLQNQALVTSLTERSTAIEQLNRDVTKEIQERRLVEEELRQTQGDLERRIAERTTDLAQANESLLTEVEERRRTERALFSSEKRFNHLTDNLNQGVWFAQVEPPQVLYVNPAFERIWGLPADRFYENPRLWRECLHQDDRASVNEAYDAALAAPDTKDLALFYRIVHPDGAVRWIHDRVVFHHKSDGTVDQISGITEDITESRALEQRLREAQKMEAVGRLAGGVAHDFNNVMTVILGYSAVLLQEMSQQSSARHFVQEIQRAGERCAALTSQLLAFSRKQMLHPVSLDLHRVIRDLMSLLRSLLGEHITVVLRLDPTPRWVKVDAVQMEQVIINLAVNARDAMPQGGTLTIETDEIPLSQVRGAGTGSRTDRPYVRFRVHDTGIGMDADTQARVFEPFFTTKPQGQGTGLGLATVYGIVHQSGGTISVDSKPGLGTTMTICLPQVTPVGPPMPATVLPPDTKPGTEAVLLVEDDPSVRLLTQHVLRMHGFLVYEAADGIHALDLIRQHPVHVDVLVTDLVMPGMNGKELAKRLRGKLGPLKAVYVSGYSDSAPIVGDDADGQSAFLAKPFSPEDLIRTIRQLLQTAAPAALSPPQR
ncbi:MAG: PAS domain-containing protein [Nitrospiraceae bacterium]|nr:PAS domain-containing protein [Nitrospiraceae bacterium]